MTHLNFAGTGLWILLHSVSSYCWVIPSRKFTLNLNGEISYWELARRPWPKPGKSSSTAENVFFFFFFQFYSLYLSLVGRGKNIQTWSTRPLAQPTQWCTYMHEARWPLVFNGGYHAWIQKLGKRVVFLGEARTAQTVFRVSKTAKIKKKEMFFLS